MALLAFHGAPITQFVEAAIQLMLEFLETNVGRSAKARQRNLGAGHRQALALQP